MSRNKKNRKVLEQIVRGGLAATGVLTAVTTVVTGEANAGVIYSGVINFACAVDIDGAYINVETATLSNGPGTGVPGWDVNPYSTSGGMNFFNSTGGGQMRRTGVTTGTAGNLALGTVIGSAGSFNTSTGNVYGTTAATGLNGGWTLSSENIIGFRFVGADNLTHYGWMRFLMGAAGSAGTSMTRTVVDYGYESTAATSILAGAGAAAPPSPAPPSPAAVPEPSSLALLAVGAAGLIQRRRRQAAKLGNNIPTVQA